jgi:hypothetical protein
MASDLAHNLKTFECYVSLVDYGLTRTRLRRKSYGEHNKPLIIRPDLSMGGGISGGDVLDKLFSTRFDNDDGEDVDEPDENTDTKSPDLY